MNLSGIPAKFFEVFAKNASGPHIRALVQTTSTYGQASLDQGFPAETFTSVPPTGKDFNGIFQAITQWNQWQQAGAAVPYDSAFSTAIGGYPKGARLLSTDGKTVWTNIVDANTTNPDSGGSNWLTPQELAFNYAADTGSTNAVTIALSPVLPAHVVGMPIFAKILHTNTGAVTFNPGPGAVAVLDQGGNALTAGQLVAGTVRRFIYDGTSYQTDLAPVYSGPTITDTGTTRIINYGGKYVRQLGVANAVAVDSTVTITFPTAFAAAPPWYAVGVSAHQTTPSFATDDNIAMFVGTTSTTQMTVGNNKVNGSSVIDVSWWAEGYIP